MQGTAQRVPAAPRAGPRADLPARGRIHGLPWVSLLLLDVPTIWSSERRNAFVTALTGDDHIPLTCKDSDMTTRPMHSLHRPRRMKGRSAELDRDQAGKFGQVVEAHVFHAVQLHAAAAGETYQDVAITRAADGDAIIILVNQVREAQHVDVDIEVLDRILAVAVVGEVDEGVEAITAFDGIVATGDEQQFALSVGEIGVDDVVAVTARDAVAAKAADQRVVTIFAGDSIGACAAVDIVVALFADDVVVAAAAMEGVLAIAAG